ncbi:MAG: LysM peptidoglycan-binding domain-containing protein, partial [Caldimonas sp.]
MTRRLRIARHARRATSIASIAAFAALSVGPSQAATYPITAEQRSTAQRAAQSGVALSELLPNAPDSYTVKPHDTLWGISGLYLKSPWRWPELWGMNLEQVPNPHLIFPGQVLFLD